MPMTVADTFTRIDLTTISPYDLCRELERRISALDRERRPEDQFSCDYVSVGMDSRNGNKLTRIPQRWRWTACYPVTGGSEGWYLHVVAIYQHEEDGKLIREGNRYVDLAMLKIFGGWDRAAELAGLIGQWLDA